MIIKIKKQKRDCDPFRAAVEKGFGRHMLPAVLTVEAAAVMIIVLTAIAGMILFCFRLHDRVAAQNALIYSIEVFSHRKKEGEQAERYRKIAENTQIYITGEGKQVTLEPGILPNSITGTVSFGEQTWERSNLHLNQAAWLRISTLADFKNLPEEKKKKKEAGNDNS